MARTHTIQQFAELAGVSVRALRHYDRIGLLTPARNEAGYRVYGDDHLETLAHIIALKFIGLPLKQIKAVLHRDREGFARAFIAQRTMLEEKRLRLDCAIVAIKRAERSMSEGHPVDVNTLKQIIEVLEMPDSEAPERYQRLLDAKIRILQEMGAEQRAALGQKWAVLFGEIEAVLNEDPASPRVQQLVDRWMELLKVFNKGAAVGVALTQASAYRVSSAEWPKGMQSFRNPRVWEFVGKALAIRG